MEYFGSDIFKIMHDRLKIFARRHRYDLRHVIFNKRLINKTRQMQNCFKDKSVFVLANGPSIRKLDPYKIAAMQAERGYHVIAMNDYFISDFAKIVMPDIYVLSDPLNFILEHEYSSFKNIMLSDYGIPENEIGNYLRTYKNCLQFIKDNKLLFFLPLEQYSKVDYDNKYAFYNHCSHYYQNVWDILRPFGYSSNTSFKALSVAAYLGYAQIFICGFDADFRYLSVNEENRITWKWEHFYNTETIHQPMNDMLATSLHKIALYFAVFRKFTKYNIINLDRLGLIDSFSKKVEIDVYGNPKIKSSE